MADLLTTGQVQSLLRVDRTTIYRMVEDGRLPAIRVGKQWRFDKDKIERWLLGQTSSTAVISSLSLPISQAPQHPASILPTPFQFAEILPLPGVQLIQDAFAEILGVMLLITDMRGRPVTEISNPCAFFVAATQKTGGVAACTRTRQELAESISLEPRYFRSEIGLLCTRGLIRFRSDLKGMLVVSGIAPDIWPPSREELASIAADLDADVATLQTHVDAVYRLERAQREKTLHFAQRIADIFSYNIEDRSLLRSKLQAIASLTAL